jgi:hypothetical protein
MALKNTTIFILVLLFLIANVVDIITAYFIAPGEANPLYVITKNMLWIDMGKVIIVALAIFYYRRNIYPSPFSIFLFVSVLLLGTFIISLGAYSNIRGIMEPQLVEEASKVSGIEKVKAYMSFVSILYVFPVALALFSFKMYEWASKRAIINKEYFKKQPWWKI